MEQTNACAVLHLPIHSSGARTQSQTIESTLACLLDQQSPAWILACLNYSFRSSLPFAFPDSKNTIENFAQCECGGAFTTPKRAYTQTHIHRNHLLKDSPVFVVWFSFYFVSAVSCSVAMLCQPFVSCCCFSLFSLLFLKHPFFAAGITLTTHRWSPEKSRSNNKLTYTYIRVHVCMVLCMYVNVTPFAHSLASSWFGFSMLKVIFSKM